MGIRKTVVVTVQQNTQRELINKIKDLNVLGNILIQAVTLQSVEAFQSVASQYVTEDELKLANGEQNSGESSDDSDG